MSRYGNCLYFWHCDTCNKTLTTGTMAPSSVVKRHLKTKRHQRLEAEKKLREVRK